MGDRLTVIPDRTTDLNESDVIFKDGRNDFTADQSMGGFALTDLDDPTNAQDAATKAYVDGAISGAGHDASVITFTPAVATDWDGDADPGNVDDALDQLAERVTDIEADGTNGTGNDHALVRRNGTGGDLEDCDGWTCSDAGKITGRSTVFPADSPADGATITFNLNAANFFEVTLGGNRTLAISNATVGQNFTIALKQDGTASRTVTWFSNIYWPGGTEPTLTTTAGKVDEFGFRCIGLDSYGDPVFRGHVLGLNFGG